MNRDKLIKQLEEALKSADSLYNDVANGEVSFKQAGIEFDAVVGWETVQALSKALIYLKEENE
jgi:hypothetical protein